MGNNDYSMDYIQNTLERRKKNNGRKKMINVAEISKELQSCSIVELDIMKNYLENRRTGIKRSTEPPFTGASKAENLLYKLFSLLIQNLEIRIQELKKK